MNVMKVCSSNNWWRFKATQAFRKEENEVNTYFNTISDSFQSNLRHIWKSEKWKNLIFLKRWTPWRSARWTIGKVLKPLRVSEEKKMRSQYVLIQFRTHFNRIWDKSKIWKKWKTSFFEKKKNERHEGLLVERLVKIQSH